MTRIVNNISGQFVKYVAGIKIKKLLKLVPEEDLIGIDKIILVDKITTKNGTAAGRYVYKHGNQLPYIEIGIHSILSGSSIILLFLPISGSFFLGQTLYHEIGHHKHFQHSHGIRKRSFEKYANDYENLMLRKKFLMLKKYGRPFYIVFSFAYRNIRRLYKSNNSPPPSSGNGSS